jgi:hypothetical protein
MKLNAFDPKTDLTHYVRHTPNKAEWGKTACDETFVFSHIKIVWSLGAALSLHGTDTPVTCMACLAER